MTAQQIADLLLLNRRGITAERIKKAQGLAKRYQIEWASVEALLPSLVKESE